MSWASTITCLNPLSCHGQLVYIFNKHELYYDADDHHHHYEYDAGDNAGGRLSAGALSASSLVARLTPFELLRISESTQQCTLYYCKTVNFIVQYKSSLFWIPHMHKVQLYTGVQLLAWSEQLQQDDDASISESDPSTSALAPINFTQPRYSYTCTISVIMCCISSVFLLYLYFYLRILLHLCAFTVPMSIIRNQSRQSDIFTDFR